MDYVMNLFSAVLDWLVTIFERTNTLDLFIGAFTFIVVYRFLIRPLFGGFNVGSDKVRTRKVKGDISE